MSDKRAVVIFSMFIVHSLDCDMYTIELHINNFFRGICEHLKPRNVLSFVGEIENGKCYKLTTDIHQKVTFSLGDVSKCDKVMLEGFEKVRTAV